ncbi:MAG: hypothetical protein AAB360_03325 [Patescibacteria group bacterium]
MRLVVSAVAIGATGVLDVGVRLLGGGYHPADRTFGWWLAVYAASLSVVVGLVFFVLWLCQRARKAEVGQTVFYLLPKQGYVSDGNWPFAARPTEE